MSGVLSFLREFNVLTVLIRLVLAALFGGIIGIERGRQRRAAGLRTHILVCIGAALTATLGYFAAITYGFDSDPLRVSAQVISGIGFLGVGTILLKGRFQITGLTTAAGLWVTAAIGIALGIGFYEGAFIAFVISVITVMLLNRLERTVNNNHSSFGIYAEIRSDENVRACVDFLEQRFAAVAIQVTVPRSGVLGNVGIEAAMYTSKEKGITLKQVETALEELEYVVFAIESV